MKKEGFTGKDDQLKSIIQKAGLEEPSTDFTARLMSKIQAAPARQFTYQPVISFKGWLLTALVIFVLCLFIFLSPSKPGAGWPELTPYMEGFRFLMNESVSGLLSKTSSLSSFTTVALLLICGWVLYGADRIVRKLIVTRS